MGCKTPFLVLLREENYGDLVSFVCTCELINLLLGWSGEKKRGVIFLSQKSSISATPRGSFSHF